MGAKNEPIHTQRSHGLSCDSLLAGGQNVHLGELINNHKNVIVSMLG